MLHDNIVLFHTFCAVESLRSNRGSGANIASPPFVVKREKIVADTKQNCCRNCCVLRIFSLSLSLTFFVFLHSPSVVASLLNAPACCLCFYARPLAFECGGEWNFRCETLYRIHMRMLKGIRDHTFHHRRVLSHILYSLLFVY